MTFEEEIFPVVELCIFYMRHDGAVYMLQRPNSFRPDKMLICVPLTLTDTSALWGHHLPLINWELPIHCLSFKINMKLKRYKTGYHYCSSVQINWTNTSELRTDLYSLPCTNFSKIDPNEYPKKYMILKVIFRYTKMTSWTEKNQVHIIFYTHTHTHTHIHIQNFMQILVGGDICVKSRMYSVTNYV